MCNPAAAADWRCVGVWSQDEGKWDYGSQTVELMVHLGCAAHQALSGLAGNGLRDQLGHNRSSDLQRQKGNNNWKLQDTSGPPLKGGVAAPSGMLTDVHAS